MNLKTKASANKAAVWLNYNYSELYLHYVHRRSYTDKYIWLCVYKSLNNDKITEVTDAK